MTFTATDPVSHEGQTNVWLTPKWILKALGPFDLDPCGHPGWKTAENHIYGCGLEADWSGRVWLNPPYGRNIDLWLKKLEHHGNGVALVFARTDTEWFQKLSFMAINFMKGRVAFRRPDGSKATNAGAPSCLLAWGSSNVKAISRIPGRVLWEI